MVGLAGASCPGLTPLRRYLKPNTCTVGVSFALRAVTKEPLTATLDELPLFDKSAFAAYTWKTAIDLLM